MPKYQKCQNAKISKCQTENTKISICQNTKIITCLSKGTGSAVYVEAVRLFSFSSYDERRTKDGPQKKAQDAPPVPRRNPRGPDGTERTTNKDGRDKTRRGKTRRDGRDGRTRRDGRQTRTDGTRRPNPHHQEGQRTHERDNS